MEYMDLLPPTATSLVFARETCRPYKLQSRGVTPCIATHLQALLTLAREIPYKGCVVSLHIMFSDFSHTLLLLLAMFTM